MAEESKNAVVESKAKKQKPKKEKQPNRLARKVKETGSELRKVTWPTFPVVVKSISVVLAVCAVFLVVLLGFDLFLSYLVYNPLTSGTINGEEVLSSVFANTGVNIGGFLNAFRGIVS